MKNKTEHIMVGELEIPSNYWSLDTEEKRALCLTIIDGILTLLDKQISYNIPKKMFVNKLLESSIITNLEEENYEICQVLTDIKTIFNE